jgi:anti-sigma B factor antagonist
VDSLASGGEARTRCVIIAASPDRGPKPMALDIQQREHESIVILDLKGRITVGPEASALRERIAALTAAGTSNLVFNLKDVDYIDSTGLGALVICATSLRKIHGDVKLLNLSRRNIELLVMTKLATIFEIFADEQDAVNSFYPDRKIKTFDILSFVQDMKNEE